MKRGATRGWIMLAVVLVVYNVIVFAVPFIKNAVFFLSWIFTLIAIVAQTYVISTAFRQGEGIRSKFYGFPIARIGVFYLIAQLVLGLIFASAGFVVTVPFWIPLVLYVALLGVSAVGIVAADTVRNEVVRQDVKLVKDTSRMRNMQSKIQLIASQNTDATTMDALETLSEHFRFSDPVSSKALTEIEDQLEVLIVQLQQAVDNQERATVLALCKKIDNTLFVRNTQCRLSKHL